MALPADAKLIPGAADYYATPGGQIWSCYHRQPRRLVPSKRSGGYYVGVVLGGRRRSHAIHRLVALTFLGKRPPDRPDVCHLDGDVYNNAADNLAWSNEESRARLRSGARRLSKRRRVEFMRRLAALLDEYGVTLSSAVRMVNEASRPTPIEVAAVKDKHLSYEDGKRIATEMGIPHNVLWRIERGHKVDPAVLQKLRRWLRRSPSPTADTPPAR